MREELLETEAIEMPATDEDGGRGAAARPLPARGRARSRGLGLARRGAHRGARRRRRAGRRRGDGRGRARLARRSSSRRAGASARAAQGAPGEGASPAARSWSTSTCSATSSRVPPRGALEVEVRPPWPYRLPVAAGGDGVARRRGGGRLAAARVDGERGRRPRLAAGARPGRAARRAGASRRRRPRERSSSAIERMRFALGVDEDLSEFARAFRGDPLIGAAIHHRPWHRPRRRPWPWEALAWAVTEQLIEAARAGADPAPDRAPLGPPARALRRRRLARPGTAARRALGRGDRRPGAGRARRLRPRADARDRADHAARARSPPGGSTPPTPSGDRRLLRIPEIGPGRSRCSGSAAAASPTRCPPATSPT